MSFSVYVIKSKKDGRLYKGMTENLEKRIEQHNKAKNKSTKGFLPWVLVYSKTFTSRIEAREHEKYLKSGIGREFLSTIV